ncbi:MAG: TolC family protein [Desulfobacteraceae bacterium]|nr:TolC family protein [Desulfobacteraceae bacterium]
MSERIYMLTKEQNNQCAYNHFKFYIIIAFILFNIANIKVKAEKIPQHFLLSQNFFPTKSVEKKDSNENGIEHLDATSYKYTFSLEEAVNFALKSNRDIISQQESLQNSKLSLNSAETEFEISIIPSGDVGFSDSDDEANQARYKGEISFSKKLPHGSLVTINPAIHRSFSDDSDTDHQTSINLSLVQPLFRGISREYNLSAIHSAEYNVRSAYRNLHMTRIDTIIQTVNAVYEIIKQEELVKIYWESADRLKGFADTARIKKEIGMAEPEDVYRANQKYKQAQDILISSQEALKNAKDNLKIILNIPIKDDIEVKAPFVIENVEISEEDAIRITFENRIELEEAEDFLREKYRISRISKENTLPDFNVNFSYSWLGNDEQFERSMSLHQNRWSIGFTTTTDFFRRSEKFAYRQSLLSIESAKRKTGLLRDNLVKQLKNEIRNLNRSAKQVILQQSRIDEAKSQLELSRIKFKHGFANNFDLIEAETVLRSAQTNLISAMISYIVGTYRLRAAMGTILEKPGSVP